MTTAVIVVLAACAPAPQAQNLDPRPVPRVVGNHVIQPDLATQIDAFFANDFADAFRNRRAIYITVAGAPVVKRYHHSLPGTTYDVGALDSAILATLVGIAINDHRIRGVDENLGQLLSSTSSAPEVSAILSRAIGGSVAAYAEQRLFGPLGIILTDSGNRLRLNAIDLARLGALWLNYGSYGGRQIVPAAWVAQMTRPWSSTGDQIAPSFGYGVWLTSADGHDAFAASGAGGQVLEVVPDLQLVVVVQSATDLDVIGRAGGAGADEYLSLVDTVVARAIS